MPDCLACATAALAATASSSSGAGPAPVNPKASPVSFFALGPSLVRSDFRPPCFRSLWHRRDGGSLDNE
jgi:hypothetical protein